MQPLTSRGSNPATRSARLPWWLRRGSRPVAAASAACCAALLTGDAAASPPPAKAQLSAIARSNEMLTRSYAVRFTDDPMLNGAPVLQETVLSTDPDAGRWGLLVETFATPQQPGIAERKLASFDGSSGVAFSNRHSFGSVGVSQEYLKDFIGHEFPGMEYSQFLMRWISIGEPGSPWRDLLAVLDAPSTSVRAQLEEVDGVACAVLDVFDEDGLHRGSVWLDADRGCLPVRQEWYGDPSHAPEATYSLRILQAAQVASGGWMPTKGVRALPGGAIVTMEVAADPATGGAAIRTGGSQDLIANPWDGVPAGAEFLDVSTRALVIVRADDAAGCAEDEPMLAQRRTLNPSHAATVAASPSRGQGSMARRTGNAAPDAGVEVGTTSVSLLAVGLAGVGLTFVPRRRGVRQGHRSDVDSGRASG